MEEKFPAATDLLTPLLGPPQIATAAAAQPTSGQGQAAPGQGVALDPTGHLSPSLLVGYPNSTTKFLRGDGTWATVSSAGTEISYTQITGNVNIVSTTESAGTTIISPAAATFDGNPVWCHFSGILSSDNNAANDFVIVCLFEGSTQITRLVINRTQVAGVTNQVTIDGWYRFTPTAGSHTYTITAFASSTAGTPLIGAGSGGTAGNPPAFVRFVKV